MGKSCVWNPEKGNKLFKELKEELGRPAGATVYNYAIGESFQDKYKDSLTFDGEGIPTIESVIQIQGIEEAIGLDKVLEIINKKEPVLQDTQDNVERLIKRAAVYNKEHENKVAIVDFASKNKIAMRILPRNEENELQARRQQAVFKANKLIADLLAPMGITIGTLSAMETSVGRVGVTQFRRVMDTADQFEALIRVANNFEGAMAISEEFAHTVIGLMPNNPIVRRAIAYMEKEEHAREVLGDQYEQVLDFYDGNRTATAEEAVGHIFRDQFIERLEHQKEKNRPSLLRRLFNFILRLFKGVNVHTYHNELEVIKKGLSDIAEQIIRKEKVLTEEDIQKARRQAEFNALSKRVQIQANVLKGLVARAYKAATLIDNLEERDEESTEKGRAWRFANNLRETIEKNVGMGETMAAIASFIDYSVRTLEQYQADLEDSNLEERNIKDRHTLIRNALYMLQQFKPDIDELNDVISKDFISGDDENAILTQGFMMDDFTNKLEPYENKVPIGRHENIGNTPEEIIQYIERESEKLVLAEDESHYVNTETNELEKRVTEVIQAVTDAGASMNPNSPWVKPSTNIGTGMDELIRDVIEDKIYYDAEEGVYKTVDGNKYLDKVYPNASREQLDHITSQIMTLKEVLTKQQIKLFSRNIKANGIIITVDGQNSTHRINVAGTIDLIGYNEKTGKWRLYDFKTHRGRIDAEKIKKWRRQLSLYKQFLENKYGIEIEEISIIPVKVEYPEPKGYQLSNNEYKVSTAEKPAEYKGVKNNQLILNGKEFKDANPDLEEIISLETIPLEFVYSVLADDPTNGIGNSLGARGFISTAVGNLLQLIGTLESTINRVAKKEFVNFIKPIIGETIRIPNPKDKSKMIEVPITRVLEKADYDSSTMQKWFTTMADNPDAFLQIMDKIYKRTMDIRRLKTIDMVQRIQVLAIKYEQLGITEYSWMYEDDNQNYINKIYNQAAYNEAYKAKVDELAVKYGSPELGSKEAWMKRKELKQWVNENKIMIEEDGEKRLIPNPSIYPSIYQKLDGTAKAFYNEWMSIKGELDSLLGPKKTTLLSTIKIRRKGIERFKSSFNGEAVQNFINATKAACLRSYDDDISYKDKVKTIKDFEDREVMKLPLYYIDDNIYHTYEDLSHDAIGTLIAYADMALNYEALDEIVNPMEIGREVARKRKVLDTSGDKQKVEEYRAKSGKVYESEVVLPIESTNFWKLLDNFFESKIYNRYLEDNGSLWEGGPDTNKVVSALLKLGAAAQLGFNAIAHTANLLTGLGMTNIEAMASEFFSARVLAAADAELAHLIPEYTMDLGQRVKKNKLSLLMDYFDIKQDFRARQKNKSFLNRTIVGQIFGPRLQFIGQDAGDLYLYSRIAIAVLMSTKVLVQNENGNFEETNLYDRLDVVPIDPALPDAGNKLIIKEGTFTKNKLPVTPEFISDVTGRIRFINQKLFGVYNEEDQILLRRGVIGRFIMQYRDWYPPALRRRFGVRTTNLEAGKDEEGNFLEVEGFYRTGWRFVRQIVGELRHGQLAIKANWDALEDFERRNLKRAIFEIIQYWVLCAAVGIFAILKDRKDIWGDKKKKPLTGVQKMLRYTSLAVTRLWVELGTLALVPEMPKQAAKQVKNPAACTNIISSTTCLLDLLWLPNWTSEIDAGDYKGHTRAYRIFVTSPLSLYYNTIKRQLDPEKAEKFFTALS